MCRRPSFLCEPFPSRKWRMIVSSSYKALLGLACRFQPSTWESPSEDLKKRAKYYIWCVYLYGRYYCILGCCFEWKRMDYWCSAFRLLRSKNRIEIFDHALYHHYYLSTYVHAVRIMIRLQCSALICLWAASSIITNLSSYCKFKSLRPSVAWGVNAVRESFVPLTPQFFH